VGSLLGTLVTAGGLGRRNVWQAVLRRRAAEAWLATSPPQSR